MKHGRMTVGFVLGIAAALLMGQSGDMQEAKAPPAPPAQGAEAAMAGEMAAAMKAWKDAITPGAGHEKLGQFVGTWNTTTRMWWGGPGTPPVETRGTSEVQSVLDGRFILEKSEGTFMMPDETGQMKPVPARGMGLMGYDNYRKMFVGCWADSLGTQLLTMKGSADPSGTVFTAYGEMDEPMLGVVGRMVKYVTRVIDQDHRFFDIYDLHAGDDYKVVEIEYTRKR